MSLRIVILLQLSLILSSCSQGDSDLEVLPPTDLVVTKEVSDDRSGLVEIQASASGCSYFEFEFGESQTDTPQKDYDGFIEHTYAASGTYSITVRAHASAEVFIQTSIEVAVDVLDPDELIIPETGYSTPLSYDGYSLIWNDEFNGTELDTDVWKYETGTGSNGWGNNELQYYRKENTSVQDGYLIIEAKKESFGGRNYTSSRLITEGNKSFKYGRIDIRAALPKGQGIWPALWMLGSNFGTAGWPACGEIDIMEMIGGEGNDNTVHGTVHWDHAGSYASYGNSQTLASGIFADKFHVFTLVWTASTIEWFVDDVRFNVIDITPAELSEFQEKFFFIFNVAVGGNWPGSPDASTSFPQRMIVDYVRVFQVP